MPGKAPTPTTSRCLLTVCLLVCAVAPMWACSNRPASGLNPTALAPHRNIPEALVADGAPMIRVLLADGAKHVAVAVDGPYEIRSGKEVLKKGRRLEKSPVTSASRGSGQRQLQIAGRAVPGSELLIVPQRAASLWVHTQDSDGKAIKRRYDGYAVIWGASKGVNLVNVVSLEKYLPGVLQGELFPKFREEAFRAQAIAARTYALYDMNTVGKSRRYDVKSTEASQVYRGIEGVDSDSKPQRATDSTRGIVCTWRSPRGLKIFPTYYSSACGGVTEDVTANLPYPSIAPLAGGVRCNYCKIGGKSYRWGPVIMSKSEISDKLTKRFPRYKDLGRIHGLKVTQRTPHGRPVKLELTGEHGRRASIKAYDFRLAMGGHQVKSTHYRIIDRGTVIEFAEGHGFGHFTGMCQWGAEGQARQGRKAADILQFYYPNSKFTRAY